MISENYLDYLNLETSFRFLEDKWLNAEMLQRLWFKKGRSKTLIFLNPTPNFVRTEKFSWNKKLA